MRPNMIDIDVADESDNGIADDLTGAGPWTVTDFTITAPTDGLAHQISLASTANLSAINITLTGTDANGVAQTETRAGPNNNEVETTAYFKTVTDISASATLGVNVLDIGWVDEVSSYTYPLDFQSPYAANIQVDVTGTIDFTVQQNFTNVLAGDAPIWNSITALAAKTADTASQASIGATAIRVIVNSYSTGAELQMYTTQPGRNN